MRTNALPFVAAALVALGASQAASAQTFTIDWLTIDGGGGASAGGAYTVVGTIGQPDAGLMTGEGFSVAGGFWFGRLSPPMLSIQRSNSDAIISWQPGGSDFILQVSDSLHSDGWTDAPSGSANPVTVVTDGRSLFYRLSAR